MKHKSARNSALLLKHPGGNKRAEDKWTAVCFPKMKTVILLSLAGHHNQDIFGPKVSSGQESTQNSDFPGTWLVCEKLVEFVQVWWHLGHSDKKGHLVS